MSDQVVTTTAEFIDFLSGLVNQARWAKQIHIVLDNLSAHKTQSVRDFLAANPKVRFHFTPTYSSWLNQVEIWFSKIERDVIARGVFTSVADLHRKLMKYIRAYTNSARPLFAGPIPILNTASALNQSPGRPTS